MTSMCLILTTLGLSTQDLQQASARVAPATPSEHPTLASPTFRRGPFVSVQVNVDENGMNIVGDAGNQPTLVVDPTDPDRMAMGWRQFERANHEFRDAGYAFSRNGGRTWSFPGILAEARSDPVLDADVDGRFYYFCICTSGLCAELFRSDNGGRTWDGAG